MPNETVNMVETIPTPSTSTAQTPHKAVAVQASGSLHGILAHGQTDVYANISKAITTNGGNRIKRFPVQ
ncbi:hypothetical protein [Aureliella helgolandensis]|nr:hypothetical protein [Aureliella helgolandensis]